MDARVCTGRRSRDTPRRAQRPEGLLAIGAYAGAVGLITGVLPTVVVLAALARHRWAELGHRAVGAALTAETVAPWRQA